MKTCLAFLLAGATLANGEPARRVSATSVTFSSAVNWNFTRLDRLDAWRNTAIVLRKALAQWYPPEVPGSAVENTTRESLRAFFSRLPKMEAGDWSIIYLAGHQTRGGLWQFPRDPEQSWAEILAGAPGPARTHRMVIVDACFAEAAGGDSLMTGMGATGVLFSALRTEEAHEIDFQRRFPLDLTRRYPAEAHWLRETLGAEWDGRISFFGFIWVQAFLATPQAPRTIEDWNGFFHRCEALAREFRQGRGEALATTIRFLNGAKPGP